jgi:hypothetical protein
MSAGKEENDVGAGIGSFCCSSMTAGHDLDLQLPILLERLVSTICAR